MDSNRDLEGMDLGFRAMLEAEFAEAAARPRPAPGSLPLELAREGYHLRRRSQDPSPPSDVDSRDLTLELEGRTLRARLYSPAETTFPSALLVYFHGGGFIVGDLESHDGHCRRLAAGSGAQIMAVDYRLAPENPFPAAHDDALDAVRWAFANCAMLNVARDRIGVGGDSAGANLAASVACDLFGDAELELAVQVLLYPAIWPEEETESRKIHDGLVLSKAGFAWFDKCLRVDGRAECDRLKIARRPTATPQMIVTAGFDPLRDEGRFLHELRIRQGLQSNYVDFPDLIHDFFVMPAISARVEVAAAHVASSVAKALSGGARLSA